MKKRILILSGILALVLVSFFAYAYFNFRPDYIDLAHHPRTAQSDLPVTYDLGWWPHQHYLTVNAVRTEVLDSSLNLFTSHSLVAWIVKGSLCNPAGKSKPFVEKAHLSQRYIEYDPNKRISIGEITITPIVALKDDPSYHGDSIPFEFRIEDELQSGTWGENKYVVRCVALVDSFCLHQYK